jgi:aryl-phospho-beta-D-glucosidase BglC (GH1 family)
MHFRGRALISVAFLLLLSSSGYAQGSRAAIAQQRAGRLRRGINASEWFAQVYDSKGYTKEHFETWTTSKDIALIKSLRFDHVRLSVNPEPMFRAGRADDIPAEYLGYLDAAVKMILEQGLAVVIDLHPDSGFKAKLSDDNFVEELADFWRALAHHYSTYPPDSVFFEILNEPELRDRYRWIGIQSRLGTAIREGAPQHTILATGAYWSANDELLFLEPLRDPNVIYNFHFYSPGIFTHQGATWSVNYWHYLKGVHYPSDPASAEKAAAAVPDAANRIQVVRYGLDHWNAARIDAEISQVADWAQRWSVPVVCNEFGVYRQYADPTDRAAWIHDARTALEKYGFGWTMWDYSGSFGIVTKKDGQAAPDPSISKALGLSH